MLTVQELEKAGRDAWRLDSWVYVVEYNGNELEVVVNSATPSTFRMGNVVVAAMRSSDIHYDRIPYGDYQLTAKQFVDILNKEYEHVEPY